MFINHSDTSVSMNNTLVSVPVTCFQTRMERLGVTFEIQIKRMKQRNMDLIVE